MASGLPPLFFMANEMADTLAQEAAEKAQVDQGTAAAVELALSTARAITERAAHTTVAAIAAEDAETTENVGKKRDSEECAPPP